MRGLKAFGLIAVAAVVVAGCTKTAEDYAADVDRSADQDVVLKTLRETDPTFYGQIRDRAAGRLAAGEKEPEVLAAVQTEMRAYGLRQAPYVSAAPGASVIEVMQAEKAVIEHLQRTDVSTCAQFAMAGLPTGYQPDGQMKSLIDARPRPGCWQPRRARLRRSNAPNPVKRISSPSIRRWSMAG